MAGRITSEADLETALAALKAMDPRLAPAFDAAGPLPLRLLEPGLAGLLKIVNAQQLSTHSANALWRRVETGLAPLDAPSILARSEAELRAVGLSRQKARTFRAIAVAVADGLELESLAEADPDAAREALEAIVGVGRWTADLYLMFCAGHPDILPVGDLAVRRGASEVLARATPFLPAELDAEGARWAPHRSTATRLFYVAYARARNLARATPARRAAPVAGAAAMPL